jgi:hypothetical protein
VIAEIEDMVQRELVTIKHRCEHDGCESFDTIKCRLIGHDESKDDTFWYCGEHCHTEGFCWMCGEFWGGCEDFDFSPSGLCSNCRSEAEAEMDEGAEDDFGEFQDLL